MILHTLRVALRRLWREGGYTAIHVAGLAVGVAACVLILLYLQHERGYDRFHPNAERVVQVVNRVEDWETYRRDLPGHVGADLANLIPEIEAAAAIEREEDMLISIDGVRQYVEDFAMGSPDLFRVLDGFETVAGDPSRALAQPDGAVLTRSLAERLFGSPEAALGQTVATLDEILLNREFFEAGGGLGFEKRGEVPYTVRAVVEDLGTRSSVQFSLLVSRADTGFRGWNATGPETFLLLRPDANPAAIEAKMAAYMATDAFTIGDGNSYPVEGQTLSLQPLAEVHLRPDPGAARGSGPVQYLILFAGAALLILLIASVNYVNLATARAVRRAREVGVRKTIGASRSQLWRQFLAEAGMVVLAALALGLVLAAVMLPSFRELLGVDLSLTALATPLGLGLLLALFVGITVGSGAIPAFVLASFRPVAVLKGAPTPTGSGRWLRRGLVVFQFGASVALVIAMLGTGRQMDYIREARLNALDSQVLVVENRGQELSSAYESFKQDLLADPAIEAVSTGEPPNGNAMLLFNPLREGGEPVELNLVWAGEDYAETLGLRIVEGSGLGDTPPPSADEPILINQAAVRASDLADLPSPVGALDTKINGGDVVGVVEDYHFKSLHAPIGPLAIIPASGAQSKILVRLQAGRIAEGLETIRDSWDDAVPGRPISYAFLDESLDASYQTELRMSGLFRAFALLAVLVAAMGLFGLAAYTAEGRRKEVGVRKVLGASVAGLVGLLSRDFVALVVVAFAIAAPLGVLGLNRWLSGFAYRIEPGAGLLATTGLVVLAVALLAVSAQAYRAATADPIRALRAD